MFDKIPLSFSGTIQYTYSFLPQNSIFLKFLLGKCITSEIEDWQFSLLATAENYLHFASLLVLFFNTNKVTTLNSKNHVKLMLSKLFISLV